MNSKKNDNLLKFSTQTPWQFVFVVVLYTVGAVGFPTSIFTFVLGNSQNSQMIAIFLARALCSLLPLWLMREIKVNKLLRVNNFFSNFYLLIPFLLVVINNFPIIPLIKGDTSFVANNNFIKWICYLLAVLGGVVIEEVTFRGLIFPVLYRKLSTKKHAEFLSVLFSSALFGIVHLFNLFAGAGIGSVIMQIGYSLLIGGMCCIALLKTGNFYNCVLLHFIFNIGGLLYEKNMISGNIWTVETVIITAILGILVTVYAIVILFKNNKNPLSEKIRLNKSGELNESNN